jgi:hypothetical protein
LFLRRHKSSFLDSLSKRPLRTRICRPRFLSSLVISNSTRSKWSNLRKKKTSGRRKSSSSLLSVRRWHEQPVKLWLKPERPRKS